MSRRSRSSLPLNSMMLSVRSSVSRGRVYVMSCDVSLIAPLLARPSVVLLSWKYSLLVSNPVIPTPRWPPAVFASRAGFPQPSGPLTVSLFCRMFSSLPFESYCRLCLLPCANTRSACSFSGAFHLRPYVHQESTTAPVAWYACLPATPFSSLSNVAVAPAVYLLDGSVTPAVKFTFRCVFDSHFGTCLLCLVSVLPFCCSCRCRWGREEFGYRNTHPW